MDPHGAAQILLRQVPEVVITLGRKGCLYAARGGEPVLFPAPEVTAVDTTGAGDTFVGTLAVALGEGRSVAGGAGLGLVRRGALCAETRRLDVHAPPQRDRCRMSTPTAPLAGLRVLDLATLFAGPLAATMLGDFGAEVIKVEHPRKPDPSRGHGPSKDGIGLWWKLLGRNKRTLTLDLSAPGGRDVLLRLAAETDVVIENFRPGTLERWGLGWEELRAVNPRLVLARVTGFGQKGPYAHRPGFGTLAEAMSGFAAVTGEPDGPPTLPPFGLADSIAALATAYAVMTALAYRDRTGGGQVVDMAIIEPILTVLGPQPLWYDQLGYVQPRTGNRSRNNAPRNTYRTADGHWVAVSTSAQSVAERVMRLVGRPELTEEPWFSMRQHPRRARRRTRRGGGPLDRPAHPGGGGGRLREGRGGDRTDPGRTGCDGGPAVPGAGHDHRGRGPRAGDAADAERAVPALGDTGGDPLGEPAPRRGHGRDPRGARPLRPGGRGTPGRGGAVSGLTTALTWLYVPGDRPEVVPKALGSGADVVIVDLEDAVAPDRKEYARSATAELLSDPVTADPMAVPVHVRVHGEDDVRALAGLPGLSGMRLPKITHAASVHHVEALAPGVPLYPLLESALAIEHAYSIAGAHHAVRGIALGEADLRADLGVRDDSRPGLAAQPCGDRRPGGRARPAGDVGVPRCPGPVRAAGVLCAREGSRAARPGGDPPRQLPVIERAFRPTAREVEAAEQILEASRAQAGAQALPDGRFVDAAVVASAERTLSLARSRR